MTDKTLDTSKLSRDWKNTSAPSVMPQSAPINHPSIKPAKKSQKQKQRGSTRDFRRDAGWVFGGCCFAASVILFLQSVGAFG